ncbi:MAG: hypothetical protein GY845_00825 [Planctomycetes bacterium]|nr:hypothetical protein [Planctomycetota bacterium]
MQNKPNFGNNKMIASPFNTTNYEENGHSDHQKTNPIQTQFKPIQTQNKADCRKGTVEVIT